MEHVDESLRRKNFDSFAICLEKSLKLKKYEEVEAQKLENEELEKLILNRKGRQESSDFQTKKIELWQPQDVLSFLKMIDLEKDYLIELLIKNKYHYVEKFLKISESSPFLNEVPSKEVQKKLILNVMELKQLLKEEATPTKDYDIIVTKLLKFKGHPKINLEFIQTFARMLSSVDSLTKLLSDFKEEKENLDVLLVLSNGFQNKDLEEEIKLEEDLKEIKEFNLNQKNKDEVILGIMVDEWYFEYNNSSLIIPKKLKNTKDANNLLSFHIATIKKKDFLADSLDKIVELITRFNGRYHYDTRNNNSQYFVDSFLTHLNCVIFDPLIISLQSDLKRYGKLASSAVPVFCFKFIKNWNKEDVSKWMKMLEFEDENPDLDGNSLSSLDQKGKFFNELNKKDKIFFTHIIKNVEKKNIYFYDSEFYLCAKKFFLPSNSNFSPIVYSIFPKLGIKEGEITKLNHSSIEEIIFNLSNSDFLHKQFNFKEGDKLRLVVKDHKTSLIVGKFQFFWDPETSIVFPLIVEDPTFEGTGAICVDLNRTLKSEDLEVVPKIIADLVVRYNAYYNYSSQKIDFGRNFQHFVNEILENLDLEIPCDIEDEIFVFFERCKVDDDNFLEKLE